MLLLLVVAALIMGRYTKLEMWKILAMLALATGSYQAVQMSL